jgi:hypothetical protein
MWHPRAGPVCVYAKKMELLRAPEQLRMCAGRMTGYQIMPWRACHSSVDESLSRLSRPNRTANRPSALTALMMISSSIPELLACTAASSRAPVPFAVLRITILRRSGRLGQTRYPHTTHTVAHARAVLWPLGRRCRRVALGYKHARRQRIVWPAAEALPPTGRPEPGCSGRAGRGRGGGGGRARTRPAANTVPTDARRTG